LEGDQIQPHISLLKEMGVKSASNLHRLLQTFEGPADFTTDVELRHMFAQPEFQSWPLLVRREMRAALMHDAKSSVRMRQISNAANSQHGVAKASDTPLKDAAKAAADRAHAKFHDLANRLELRI
tara:strand:+ start:99 stop:473 length:375 start_codon:yes stop_codon:yes gene_type:complete